MCLMALGSYKNLDVSIGYACNFLTDPSTIIHIKLTLLNTNDLIASGINRQPWVFHSQYHHAP